MLTPIAYGLAVVLSLFIVLIGARFLLTPQAAAAGYGVPAAEGTGDPAYLTIKGLRDLTYGLVGSAAASGPGMGRELLRVLAAAMVYLPALWVLIGLTAALFGLLSRFASVSWIVLVGLVLLELGRELQLVSQPVLDLSPFTHVPRLLLDQVSAGPLIGMVTAALVLTAIGLIGLCRRDIGRV